MGSVQSDCSFYAFHYIPAHPGHPLHSTLSSQDFQSTSQLSQLVCAQFSALSSALSWCVHSSVAGTGASADLRSRSPFPPDVTFGPAPGLRVRILLLHQPISSSVATHFFIYTLQM